MYPSNVNGYVWGATSSPYLSDEQAIQRLQSVGESFSDQQLQIIATKGSMNVVSCAGSGKTHTLVNLVIKRILTGEIVEPKKVLLTTFSKAGALNMQERLNDLYSKVGFKGNCPVEVRTMHSVYLRFLKKVEPYLPRVLSEGERLAYVRKAAKFWKGSMTDDETQALSSLLSYQVNNLMNLDTLYNSYVFNLDMTLADFNKIVQNFYTEKQATQVMDFDDMQYRTFWYLYESGENVPYFTSLFQEFEDVYVDEFQDTSKVQYAILHKLVVDRNKCIFIGDDDQCIYEWRGSDPSIMMNLFKTFPDIQKLHLDTNYRCKSTILEFARTGVEKIRVRENKSMVSHEAGGEVKFLYGNSRNLDTYVKVTADEIERLIKQEHVDPSSIAVLSRQNATSSVLYAELILRGIYVNADSGIKIAGSNYFKDVERLVAVCDPNGTGQNNQSALKAILWKCISNLKSYQSDTLLSIMQSTGCTFQMALAKLVSYYNDDVTEAENMVLNGRQEGRISNLAYSLGGDTLGCLNKLYKILRYTDTTQKLSQLMQMYEAGVEGMTKKESSLRLDRGLYKFFMDRLDQMGFDRFNGLIQQLKLYQNADFSAFGPCVRMCTMHGAKGLEWKYVFLYAYDNYTFPDAAYSVDKVKPEEFERYFDGERRLAYVSATRAIDCLYIVTDTTNISYLCLEQLGLAARALSCAGYKSMSPENIQNYLGYVTMNSFQNAERIWLSTNNTSYRPLTNKCFPKAETEQLSSEADFKENQNPEA